MTRTIFLQDAEDAEAARIARDHETRLMLTMADVDAYLEALADDLADEYEWDDDDPEPEPTPAPVVTRQPLWASMLANSNGRLGADSRTAKIDRRQRRRELDRAARMVA